MTLESLKPKPDEEILKALRDVLERAERGEIQQLAIVASDGRPDGWTTWYVGNRDSLVAGLERMKFRILKTWV